MQETERQPRGLSTGLWLLIVICTGAVALSLACGAAYSGIKSARSTAAKASLGQIESVMLLAEQAAEADGFTPQDGAFTGMLTSYSGSGQTLTRYEKYLQETMMTVFGSNREFDFAVTRYEDSGGTHTYLYYFPQKGRTDLKNDRYFLLVDGQFSEHNG